MLTLLDVSLIPYKDRARPRALGFYFAESCLAGFVGTQGSTVVVSISGTNTSSDASIAVDVDFPLVDVDGSMFPSSSGVQLHQGFYGAFQRMQPGILSAVQTDIAAGANSVLVVGHSLGESGDPSLRPSHLREEPLLETKKLRSVFSRGCVVPDHGHLPPETAQRRCHLQSLCASKERQRRLGRLRRRHCASQSSHDAKTRS